MKITYTKFNFYLIFTFLIYSTINSQTGCWKEVINRGFSTFGIKNDGTLWAFGGNGLGDFGNGTTESSSLPVQIGSDANWSFIDYKVNRALAIKEDGTAWGWGFNQSGQIGAGTNTDSYIPLQIGSDSDWLKLAAGSSTSYGIKNDGTLWAWGDSFGGAAFGINGASSSNIPVQIGLNEDNWVDVIAGGGMFIAIKSDGSIWGAGRNNFGHLGSGDFTPYEYNLIQVGNNTYDWGKVTVEYDFCLAIKTDGTLWAWGRNQNGQLGDGTTAHKYSPVQIGTDNDWIEVDAGGTHTLALKANGTLWAWGNNIYGQLGNGTTTGSLVPIQIGIGTVWKHVSAGIYESLCLSEDDELWVWGRNQFGQLGNGTETTIYTITGIPCPDNMSVEDISENENILLYPNPVKDKLFIKNNAINDIERLTIYDVQGKEVLMINSPSSEINVENLTPGMYWVQVNLNGTIVNNNFIKQ